ncbi:hypothetical protein ABMA27_001330 [Loxostege sticticalis]|uniref:FLYWCH-type domain-containing protein n=1 Tax=Loxostege sticticalis TaxID=481309 RepID=A0ABR3HY26_LOXSC
MLGGFTFAQNHTKRLWYCSQKKKGCRARVRMDDAGRIVAADTYHDHTPPDYHVTSSGEIILLRSHKKLQLQINNTIEMQKAIVDAGRLHLRTEQQQAPMVLLAESHRLQGQSEDGCRGEDH